MTSASAQIPASSSVDPAEHWHALLRPALAEDPDLPTEFFARLREAFADPEIVELTFVTGLITMLNRFNNALQIRHGGEYDGVRVG